MTTPRLYDIAKQIAAPQSTDRPILAVHADLLLELQAEINRIDGGAITATEVQYLKGRQHPDYILAQARELIVDRWGSNLPCGADSESTLRTYLSGAGQFVHDVTEPWRKALMDILNTKPPLPMIIPTDEAERARMDAYIAEHHPHLRL